MPKSTTTLQNFVDNAMSFGDIQPVLTASGFSMEPALTAMNDAMNGFFSDYGYKFNEFNLPQFYTNSWQQDYAIPGLTTLSWLQRGTCFGINSTALGKPQGDVQIGRDQQQSTSNMLTNGNAMGGSAFTVNWLPNNILYYGTWGDSTTGNNTLGNNPMVASVYTNPLGSNSQPVNPITQIQDANGNFLVLTTYGVEGTTAPVAPVNSLAGVTASGTAATTVWTVVDPYGQGIRIYPVPSQSGCVWQFNLVGQATPPRFNSTNGFGQTISPVTDEYEPHLRALFIAQLYRYSSEAKIRQKFATEWELSLKSLAKARMKSDRERDLYKFVVTRSVKDGVGGSASAGPFWPYGGRR